MSYASRLFDETLIFQSDFSNKGDNEDCILSEDFFKVKQNCLRQNSFRDLSAEALQDSELETLRKVT